MPNGDIIASKVDDNSFVKFDIFDKNFSNNFSINFIGDSGSGKSLAAKLLLTRFLKNKNNKFIIIDSSLEGWEKTTTRHSGHVEKFKELKSENDTLINDSQINLFNFYSLEKDIETSQKLFNQILNELNSLSIKKDANYFLIIDEAWKLLINENSKVSSELLSKIARTGRSMNLGLWTISQKPGDINRDIHSNASNSFIFQIKEEEDKKEISSFLSLSEKEKTHLFSSEIKERGTALFKNQYFSDLIKFIFNEEEFEFLNSEHKV